MNKLKQWRWNCPIVVQANNVEEARERIEQRLKAALLHPEGLKDFGTIEVISHE